MLRSKQRGVLLLFPLFISFLSLGQKSKVIFVPGPILFSFTILLFLKDFLNNSKKK
ncbi:hypothetical protein A4V06_11765 [Enterococcus faecalis]|nr:hypothetical protein A4V06_11765 [Enterococcus faecalis]ASU25730.1 hypothetical protein ADH73_06265 [Enterococcus faecalis]